jgi:putative membrane protein
MAVAVMAAICSLNSLRIPAEKRLTMWTQFQRRARFSTKKVMRRRSRLCQISGTLPQHARDLDNPCPLNYRGYFNPNVADKEKEEAMKFRRTVYDHEDWRRHRSSTRHARHLLSIPTSRVAYAIWPPVLSLTSIAAITTGYNEAVMAQALPQWMPLLHLSTLPLSFTASCLSLLLVFRTNSSYTRFDEARKAWATTMCRTRDIVRQALTWMQHPADAKKLHSFLNYAASFPYTLKSILVEDADIKSELSYLLEPEDLEAVLKATHPCNYVLQIISEIIHNSAMRDMEKSMMDMNITQLHDSLGNCERIFGTPLPLSYTRLTSRFLIIWHIILPIALWDPCNWIAVPATFISASSLFCIDEVGVLIEEPFPLLALPDFCDDIRKNIAGLVAAHDFYHVQTSAPSEKP